MIKNLRDCSELLPILAQWHHDEWHFLNPNRTFDQRIEKMQCYLDDNIIPSTWVVVDNDGSAGGSAALLQSDMDSRTELGPWLGSVYVDEAQRGCGLGTVLVQHVMHEARHAGITQLYLYTLDQSPFYRKLGWEDLEETEYHGASVTIMTCHLNK